MNRWTSLHYSSFFYNIEVVKYLVSKGANKNAKDKYGKTPYDVVNSEIRELLK